MNETLTLTDNEVVWTSTGFAGQMRAKWLTKVDGKKYQVFLIPCDDYVWDDPEKTFKKVTITVEDL